MLALIVCAVLASPVQETITVSRVLVDVRVTRYVGEQVTGLTPEDFDVRIGGKRMVVESAEWIDDGVAESPTLPVDEEVTPRTEDVPTTRKPRLYVLFVQTDFTRYPTRVHGQMNFLRYAKRWVEALPSEDRVAVFSFDSHLKFRLDFTGDREAITRAIDDTLFIDEPPPPPVVPTPSLASRLDRQAMRRAPDSEEALLIVANALDPIPGPKTLLLLGWGLGHLTSSGVRMKWNWSETRDALLGAGVSVISLDTTYADSHDLQTGLIVAAEETGGFYAKTHEFPQMAVDRVERTLSGHYELELRAPVALETGSQPLDVRVKKRGVTVLAPSSVLIRR